MLANDKSAHNSPVDASSPATPGRLLAGVVPTTAKETNKNQEVSNESQCRDAPRGGHVSQVSWCKCKSRQPPPGQLVMAAPGLFVLASGTCSCFALVSCHERSSFSTGSTLRLPLSILTTAKTVLPTFHSCLVSRTYDVCLRLTFGKQELTIVTPLQIIAEI